MYGTLKSTLTVDEKLVCVITPKGAAAIKKEFPKAFIVNVATDMKTSVIRAIARETILTPSKLKCISDRAYKDYELFDDPVCDFTVNNGPDTSLDELVQIIVDAHMAYDVSTDNK